jgi:hypothetical protein
MNVQDSSIISYNTLIITWTVSLMVHYSTVTDLCTHGVPIFMQFYIFDSIL